ncbi:hypothetical protein LSH36_72g08048 [Paralvinella palmiformis]|uniref:alpha-mannosidase n=1 Tax=Paralvinella palmiformis TaxID=53620 RepID=A0AAD9K2Z5_9ANNE|nr:hypothetical protein LSH36_72g08048 [Paralvinella palmiformis]
MSSTRPPPGYVLKNWTTTYDRVAKFISDTYFTDVNLYGKLYPASAPVKALSHFAAPGRIPFDEAVLGPYEPAAVGDSFGPTWSTHWFKVDLEVPTSMLGKWVQFCWESGTEAMVWSANGTPLQGFTSEQKRIAYLISQNLEESERIQTLYVEMACNRMFGAGEGDNIFPPNPDLSFTLRRCDVRTLDKAVFDLCCDFAVMSDVVKALKSTSNRGHQALQTGNAMVTAVDVSDPSTYQEARDMATAFFAQTNGASQFTLHAIGNCHIDSAWLWEYEETKRKVARSWSSTLRLLDLYPQFKFTASQAQQFEWLKDNYPELFSQVVTYNTAGRFTHVGGTWIEMDGNVPSGEGFARQFLVGQRFYEENFGSRCTEFWLPDTFGYSPQLPQIIRQSGISRFVTQKISWNLVNTFPHNTFFWQGIDGSDVLTHFPPGDSYVMQGRVDEMMRSVDNFKDKGRSNVGLYLYGHGDGGQGPNADMIERITRLTDCDQIPKIQFSTPADFFQALESGGLDNLNVWRGELFLELHNGTYTTRSLIKKNNRQCEFLLCHVEMIGTLAEVLTDDESYTLPVAELLHLWKLVLLNQFHDVTPGTSIQIAHEAALQYYSEVQTDGATLLTGAVNAFFAAQNDPSPVSTNAVFNLTSWERTNVIIQPSGSSTKGLEQIDKDGNTLVSMTCPSFGYSKLISNESVQYPASVIDNGDGTFTLSNGLVRAVIDSSGRVTGLFEKDGTKNAIASGEYGNQILFFEDVPMYWDAWDVMDYHLETMKKITETTTAAHIVESGPLRATLEVKLRISDVSDMTQWIMLEADSRYVKFDTSVNWNESHKFLKVEFPVNAYSQSCTYECQYGFLERPTHFNTSWDWTKYEVFGHKWADYSEYDWGLSILNDCKYGWSCIGNRLRLSLLRSPKNPDPTSDMGTRTFVYAALPHSGTLQEAGTIQAGWELNVPLQVHNSQISDSVATSNSYVQIDNPAIILGALKLCEDDKYSFIVRLYEAYGGRYSTTVTINNLPEGILSAQLCNILEDVQGQPLPIIGNNSFSLTFTPFQIQTVKVTFKTAPPEKK